MKKLKIYFTSDVHGYMYPTDYRDESEKNMGMIKIINEINKDSNTLVIDGGDTIQGSPFTNYLSNTDFHAHPVADILNHGGYDYITLGNHDFNYGYEYLKKYLNTFNGKCLCANVTDNTGSLNIPDFDIKVMDNGLKVGVIGFTTEFINRWERPDNLKNFTVSETYSAVSKAVKEIKDSCDILIGVYHGGFEYDLENHKKLSDTKENLAYKICQDFDFDILLTGHQHMALEGHVINGTHIVQTPPNGTAYALMDITFNDSETLSVSSSLITPASPAENTMKEKYSYLQDEVQNWLDTPVGHLDMILEPDEHIKMAVNGSPMANFINQIQLEASGADISVTSFANSIKGFNQNVTVRDITSTYMFPNTLAVLKVDGNILKAALERSASYIEQKADGTLTVSDLFLKPKVEHYNYDYFANIEYIFDISKPIGERVVSMKFKGQEIKENDTLTLAMNNYRATGAGGYDFYTSCEVVKEVLQEMPDIIIDYFRTHKEVTVDKTQYITVIQ